MEYLFTVFAIVWIVFQLPVPPAGGVGMTKFVIGLLGILLLVLAFLGMVPHHGG